MTEELEAGARFLGEFQKFYPVRAAFWLYDSENSMWWLHVASERFTDANDAAIRKLIKVARALNDPWFESLPVKLLRADDPLAQAAVAALQRYPMKGPGRFPARLFGHNVEGVYLYPLQNMTPAQ